MNWKSIFLKNLEELIKNNPHHYLQPRDELGRWTSSGSYYDTKEAMLSGEPRSIHKDVGQDSSLKSRKKSGENEKWYSNVRSFEDKIRSKGVEHGALFDSDGNALLSVVGGKDSITWSGSELDKIKGQIEVHTHNHPSGDSFSREDVFFSIDYGIKETRVVGDKYTYIIKSPDRWASYRSKFHWRTSLEKGKLNDRFNYWNGVEYEKTQKKLHSDKRGKRTVSTFNSEHFHNVWTNLSKEFDFVYLREPK